MRAALTVCIVTPAPPGSRKGNRITALRWRDAIEAGGHRVRIEETYADGEADVLVALHARRSHPSVVRWRKARGPAPLVVALTGTDLYRDIEHDADARESLQLADRLVVLQPKGIDALPENVRDKARVIVQSAVAPEQAPPRDPDRFEMCVVGHMRPVKDPFRAVEALHLLPGDSAIHLLHAGAALQAELGVRAESEMRRSSRYEWLGELPPEESLRLIARCRVLVLTSISEGGANVVCEALACGTPVIASRNDGAVGLLGADYPGYFEVGDTEGLARLMARAQSDRDFYEELRGRCQALAPMVDPARERDSWAALLAELT